MAAFPFKTALNSSTLFPFGLTVEQQVQVAAGAGFDGVELWMRDIEAYLEAGGSTAALRAAIAGSGVALVNAIAFFPWADSDPAVREQGFAQAEREIALLGELGCAAVAAPPFGDVGGTTLEQMAAHFARLVELGRRAGVEPYLECWGRAQRLSRLSEAVFVAVESGVRGARLLLDPFHMYVGGSDVHGLAYLRGEAIGVVHVNDYPAAPAREQLGDGDRVFPGEGVAPSREIARLLHQTGYRGHLSLELFRDSYGPATAREVAARGLEAIRRAYAVDKEEASGL